jgi:hypothetical protein
VFASLLPGLRDVRAPLAAGYLWLVVVWVVFEPAVPERAAADGVMASLYRAGDVLSVLGLGIALSFAAYLLGSLSTSILTPLLRGLFPLAWHVESDRFGRTAPRVPLSPQGRAALNQVVRSGREQLTFSLALSGTDVDGFLETQPDATPQVEPSPRRPVWRRAPQRDRRRPAVAVGGMQPQDRVARREGILARVVLRDLDVVATTRLLGRDQELYSAVDRQRAEVEFRLAVIPPLLVLVISLGARSDPWLLWLLVPLGAILAWGLFDSAVRSEREANEILLDSIADRRVQSPTLERLETGAANLASQTQPELMSTAASDAVVALQGAAGSLERVGTSEPSLANYARRQIDVAQDAVKGVGLFFPAPAARTAEQTLRLLTELADGWVGVIQGRPMDVDAKAQLDRAQELLGAFQAQAREAIQQARASEPTGQPEPPS